MAENQQDNIRGDRVLSAAEVEMINVIRKRGAELGDLVDSMRDSEADIRWVEEGAMDLQKGLMALERSVAKPRDL